MLSGLLVAHAVHVLLVQRASKACKELWEMRYVGSLWLPANLPSLIWWGR